MGSALAGVKGGVLAGMIFVTSIALFNVVLLYMFKPDALRIISASFGTVCTSVESNSTATTLNSTAAVQACFNDVISVSPAFFAFINFFIALFFAGLFGWAYENLPGNRPWIKGISVAAFVLLVYVYVGLIGVTFEAEAAELLYLFAVFETILFGVLLGEFYSRYTRTVEISGQGGGTRVLVDGKNVTGKKRTFSIKSVHEIKAETGDGSSFREWTVSGGVTVDDSKSFETTMEVNGDGSLKAAVKK